MQLPLSWNTIRFLLVLVSNGVGALDARDHAGDQQKFAPALRVAACFRSIRSSSGAELPILVQPLQVSDRDLLHVSRFTVRRWRRKDQAASRPPRRGRPSRACR